MKKRLTISSILCLILCLNGCATHDGLDAERAFRTAKTIGENNVFYFDEEAIALSDSLNNNGLRTAAISAYDQINDIREQYGLNALVWNGKLEQVAKVRAEESSQSFSHVRPNGSQWYTVNSKIQGGENLAYGFDNANDVVDAWMNSYSHRDNILYGEFESMAIAVYEEDGIYYWSNQFGY